jgi:tight adherence protein B
VTAATTAALITAAVLLVGPAFGASRGVGPSRRADLRRRTAGGGRITTVIAAGFGAGAVIVLTGGVRGVVDLTGVGCLGALVAWLVRSKRAQIAYRNRHDAVVALCGALAAELHAGLSTQTAVLRACAESQEFSSVERAARFGGDVPGALLALAERPGGEGLRAVAAGWTVASHSGASLAAVLDRVGDGLRDQSTARAEVESALEPPRATARMLAVLPVFGVVLGTAMGAEPLSFLLDTSSGRLCLLAGTALALIGVVWVERLAVAAARA